MGGGSLRAAGMQVKNTKFRAGYMELCGAVGREEIDIRLEQKTKPVVIISYLYCLK